MRSTSLQQSALFFQSSFPPCFSSRPPECRLGAETFSAASICRTRFSPAFSSERSLCPIRRILLRRRPRSCSVVARTTRYRRFGPFRVNPECQTLGRALHHPVGIEAIVNGDERTLSRLSFRGPTQTSFSQVIRSFSELFKLISIFFFNLFFFVIFCGFVCYQ